MALQLRLLRIRVRMWVRRKTFPYRIVRLSTGPTKRLGTSLVKGLKKPKSERFSSYLAGTSSSPGFGVPVPRETMGREGRLYRGGRRASCGTWQRCSRWSVALSRFSPRWVRSRELCPGARWDVNRSTRWAAACKSRAPKVGTGHHALSCPGKILI